MGQSSTTGHGRDDCPKHLSKYERGTWKPVNNFITKLYIIESLFPKSTKREAQRVP